MKQQARTFSTEIKQIDLDVNRTFRNHIMFRERFGVKWVQKAAYQSFYHTFVSGCAFTEHLHSSVLSGPSWMLIYDWLEADRNIVSPNHLWTLTCCDRLRRKLTCRFPFATSGYSRARFFFCFVFPLTSHCSCFPLHSFSQGVTPGSNLEAAAHTKPKWRFPHLCVILAFLSEHKAPQETAFAQKSTLTSIAPLKPIGIKKNALPLSGWQSWSKTAVLGELGVTVLNSYCLCRTSSSPQSPRAQTDQNTSLRCLTAHSLPSTPQLSRSHIRTDGYLKKPSSCFCRCLYDMMHIFYGVLRGRHPFSHTMCLFVKAPALNPPPTPPLSFSNTTFDSQSQVKRCFVGEKKELKGKKISKTKVSRPLKAMSQGADITKVAPCSRRMSETLRLFWVCLVIDGFNFRMGRLGNH